MVHGFKRIKLMILKYFVELLQDVSVFCTPSLACCLSFCISTPIFSTNVAEIKYGQEEHYTAGTKNLYFNIILPHKIVHGKLSRRSGNENVCIVFLPGNQRSKRKVNITFLGMKHD